MFTNMNVYQILPVFLNQPNMVPKINMSINDRYSSNGKNTLLWTEELCLSYDGTTASDKMTHVTCRRLKNHTVDRYNCHKGCTHRTCSMKTSNPKSSSTDKWYITSPLWNHYTWTAENTKHLITMRDVMYHCKHVCTVSVLFCLPHQKTPPIITYRTPDVAVQLGHKTVN
jgi:hypothetical protein